MCRGGFGFAIKIISQGFVNASGMRFSACSDRALFRRIAVSRFWRKVNLGGEITRWGSEALARETSGSPQSSFPLEAGLTAMVYPVSVDF